MNVLVVGGTGVIAEGAIPALLRAGHTVTLLARHATEGCEAWPPQVCGRDGDITTPSSLENCTRDIDVVLHIAGIVEEQPPDVTFARVNVEGVRHLLAEAERSGVRRFVYVSSLGADRGESDYHRSKREAEGLVRAFPREWTIVRPGGVYGPGDETISTILKMVRALPAVPVLDGGDQRFQPIWFEDLGAALTVCVDSPDVNHQIVELAGEEVLTVRELIEKLQAFTRRERPAIGIPSSIVRGVLKAGQWCGSLLGGASPESKLPISEAKLTMLLEENIIRNPEHDRLAAILGRRPTSLDEGLRRLVDDVPEQLPSDGIGSLQRKRFWADFGPQAGGPHELMDLFKAQVAEIMPIDFQSEPGAPGAVTPGATFTARLPLRGHIQIRVEKCEPTHVTFATVEGHPLAGMVEFRTLPEGSSTRFLIEIHVRSGSYLDWLAEWTIAWYFQNRTWRGVLRRLAERAGEENVTLHQQSKTLGEESAKLVEDRVSQLVRRRKRTEQLRLLERADETGDDRPHVERAHRSTPAACSDAPPPG